MNKLIHLNEISHLSDTSKEISLVSSSDSLTLQRSVFKPAINLDDVDQMFQQIISTAVEKYENNFFIPEDENTGFIKSS